ncbi:CoA-binding protein [Zunongwangia endophytica]|uniref:CoA-binding protein n=1 Tax=Zunongwangia endophytica TaxID=1808945 RepID=A0ABV8HBU3_9FLAO|nr:CoA-binding protein [Zunongwangia endophytica]MDN3593406.1 CoA-binding protein [Zunongwangia endophytica]
MKKKTLVIGASANPARYSNMAIKKLKSKQQPIVALGLREGEVDGVKIENEKIIFPDIDTVTLYVGPRNQPEYYEYIVALSPKRVIFNPGTENPELYRILKDNNIEFENACTLVMLGTNQY